MRIYQLRTDQNDYELVNFGKSGVQLHHGRLYLDYALRAQDYTDAVQLQWFDVVGETPPDCTGVTTADVLAEKATELRACHYPHFRGSKHTEIRVTLQPSEIPKDFGGTDERAGQSRILAESSTWISRTPFVPADRLRRPYRLDDERERHRCGLDLQRMIRAEFKRRDWLAPQFESLEQIEPLLEVKQLGIELGGHFTPWLRFRRDRQKGGGRRGDAHGYGFRLHFKQPVQRPIVLGYGCHFGLGQFQAE